MEQLKDHLRKAAAAAVVVVAVDRGLYRLLLWEPLLAVVLLLCWPLRIISDTQQGERSKNIGDRRNLKDSKEKEHARTQTRRNKGAKDKIVWNGPGGEGE